MDFHPQFGPVRYPALRKLREAGGESRRLSQASPRFQAYTRTAMAEKAAKPKAKAKRELGVLGTLPAKRPERLGRPRARAAKPRAAKRAPAKPATARRAAAPQGGRAPPPPRSTPPRATKPPPRPLGAPTGTELVTTTIRAAGELAQIGLTLGGQVLKRAVDRIPRP